MEDFSFQTHGSEQLVAGVTDTSDIIKRHESLGIFGKFSEFEICEKLASEVRPRLLEKKSRKKKSALSLETAN
jgi:hypothetical protein